MVVLPELWVQLCVQLQIRWSHGKLKLAENVELDEACLQQNCARCLHMWGFRTWSSSRWCGVGEASFVGLVVARARRLADEAFSERWISAFPLHVDNIKQRICWSVE